MALRAGRGAQVSLVGLAQDAARGSFATTPEGNQAEKVLLEGQGDSPTGYTVNGVTSTGAAPLDPVFGDPDAIMSAVNAITARAGGTQALATALTAGINRITVCATAADSVRLPTMVAGDWIVIINSGAASAQVFGAGTDTINAAATATGVALAATKTGLFFCPVAGSIFGGALA